MKKGSNYHLSWFTNYYAYAIILQGTIEYANVTFKVNHKPTSLPYIFPTTT